MMWVFFLPAPVPSLSLNQSMITYKEQLIYKINKILNK